MSGGDVFPTGNAAPAASQTCTGCEQTLSLDAFS